MTSAEVRGGGGVPTSPCWRLAPCCTAAGTTPGRCHSPQRRKHRLPPAGYPCLCPYWVRVTPGTLAPFHAPPIPLHQWPLLPCPFFPAPPPAANAMQRSPQICALQRWWWRRRRRRLLRKEEDVARRQLRPRARDSPLPARYVSAPYGYGVTFVYDNSNPFLLTIRSGVLPLLP